MAIAIFRNPFEIWVSFFHISPWLLAVSISHLLQSTEIYFNNLMWVWIFYACYNMIIYQPKFDNWCFLSIILLLTLSIHNTHCVIRVSCGFMVHVCWFRMRSMKFSVTQRTFVVAWVVRRQTQISWSGGSWRARKHYYRS